MRSEIVTSLSHGMFPFGFDQATDSLSFSRGLVEAAVVRVVRRHCRNVLPVRNESSMPLTRRARRTLEEASDFSVSPSGWPHSRRRADLSASEAGARRRLGKSLLVSLLIGGAGTVLSAVLGQTFAQSEGVLALITLWVFLLAGFAYFARTVPISFLFAFRASDVVWGVGLAVVLRLFGGMLNGAASAPFPAVTSPSVAVWFGEVVVSAGVVGPVVEELYFRAFLAVAVFKLLAPRTGRVNAGVAATGFSAGAFVLLHACFAPLGLIDAISLLTVGATCAVLVILTGRVWGAVLLHMSYNLLYVALSALGAILA